MSSGVCVYVSIYIYVCVCVFRSLQLKVKILIEKAVEDCGEKNKLRMNN